jgi:hypothetical protein
MATKKPSSSKPKSKPKTPAKPQLQNLAAQPRGFDDTIDEQLVDHSGVFRVTNQIAQAQTGHDETSGSLFPNDSLAMAAQRDGFRDEGPTIDEAIDPIEDEALRAVKQQRLATLRNRTKR